MKLEFESGLAVTLRNIFTFGEFKKTYMEILHLFYQRDNSGKFMKKPKLSLLDGKSFDRVYRNIEKN